MIPADAAEKIAAACAEPFDTDDLQRAAAVAGNLAIPLVQALTARVAAADNDAARYVHWGATSQDVLDTAHVLLRRSAVDCLRSDLSPLCTALATLAKHYRDTPMVARTLLQHALPTTFGLKVAGWLDALLRIGQRLREANRAAAVVQFGGAAGTLASYGTRGLELAQTLADELDLDLPDMPWHTQRDRGIELAAAIGALVGTLGKIGRDITLMMQTEVAEVAEPSAPGRGGSSALPHKRNPVGSVVAIAASYRVPHLVATLMSAMPHEHERAAGAWQAEWQTWPELLDAAQSALSAMLAVIEGLQVYPAAMWRNLDASRGLIYAEAVMMALAESLGRPAARSIVEAACQRVLDAADHGSLRTVLSGEPQVTAVLSPVRLDELFDPNRYLGAAGTLIDRVLARHATIVAAGVRDVRAETRAATSIAPTAGARAPTDP